MKEMQENGHVVNGEVDDAGIRMLLDGLEVGSVRELRELVDMARKEVVNGDRLFVNEERTVLARIWQSGKVEVARRDEPDFIWGPPVYLVEER